MRQRPTNGVARSISTSFERYPGLHGPAQRHFGCSFRRSVLVGASAVALGFGAHAATPTPTLPTGGHFAAGSGIIGPPIGGSLQISQSSSRGIINWSSFSIGAGGHVTINNGSGATLNRITGGQTSFIDGTLSATGSLYFVNPQGVVIGQGGKILGGGSIVLSTRDIQNQLFMAGGGLVASGASPGVITNEGRIVAQQGDVVLIASSVDNAGDIEAPKGAADLVAADTVLLAPVGTSGGIYVAPDSSATGAVTQSGKIAAASAALTAAGGDIYTLAGNRGGLIEAQGVATQDGQVWLTAPNGTVSVAGQVSAKAADGSGGQIVVDGKSVAIQANATLSATGTQGGQILVGVDAPGSGLAATTTIADGASILAGGPQGGGHIETSGHSLTLGNAVIEAGPGGTWLTDPTDLTIGTASAAAIENSLNLGTSVTEQTTATSFVDPSGQATTTPGNGDITVASAITWTGTGTLTLEAFNNININAAISGANGGFTANAGAAVTVSAGVSAKSVVMTAAAGNLTLASSASVSGTTGVTLQTAQNFVNSGGASITSSSGRWLIYSTNPTANTLGGLTSDFIQYNATYPGTTVAQASGNGLLYSVAPSLTLSSLTGATSKVYDGGDTATLTSSNVTVSGLLGGDTAAVSGVYGQSDVGSSLSVTTNGVAVTNGSATVYGYTVSNPTVSGNIGIITPKALSASIVGDPTKVYDQTTTATLTAANYSITGFIGSQGATVNQPSSVSYAGSSAGTQTVNATFAPTNFVANSGTNLSNYTLPASATGQGTISPAPLIVTGVLATSKVYDQTTSDTLNLSGVGAFGRLSGDSVTLVTSGATGTFSQSNVGSALTVTASGFSLTGAQASDYSLVLPTGLTASITPAPLTLSGITAANKPYDATTTATVATPGNALTGVLGSDSITLVTSGVTGTFASPNVGDGIAVSVGGYSLSGSGASNYSLSQPGGITANITPLTLTATITATPTKTYDGTANAFVSSSGYSLSGFINGQGATVIQAAQLIYQSADAGTQTVSATLAASDFTPTGSTLLSNYVLPTTAGGTGTINPAPLTIIIVGNPTKTFDATTTATLGASNFAISGFIAGEGATVNETVGTYASANAGIETVAASLAGELTPTGSTILSNYTIPSTTSGAGLINPALLTVGVGPSYNLNGSITANPTKVYDGTTTITTLTNTNYLLNGFQGSDGATINQTTGTFGSANAGGEPLMVSLTSANYVATGSTNLNNYVLPTVIYGSGTITPATITASIIGTPTKVYDGSTLSVLLASNIQFNGFVGSDGVTLSSSVAGTYAGASAGSETVSTNLIPADLPAKSGTILSNYVLPTSASGTGLITQAPLLLTGVAANDKTYDTTNSATLSLGSASLNGIVSGDTVTLSTSGVGATFAQSNAGNGIAVTATGFALTGAQAGDYSLQQPTGLTASILPKALTITGVTANNIVYDASTTGSLNTGTAGLSGVFSIDNANVALVSSGASASFSTANVGSNLAVGASGFTLSGSAVGNYSLNQPAGLTAAITAAPIIATIIGNPTKVYDGSASTTLTVANYTLSGFVGSDGATVPQSASANYVSANAGSGITINSTLVLSDFRATGSTNLSNYALPATGTGTGTITQAPLTATIVGNPTKVYDSTASASLTSANYVLSGFVGSNSATVTQTSGTYGSPNAGTPTVTASLSGGDYTAGGGTLLSNYSLPTIATGAGTITPFALTISGIVANNKTYDGATTATLNTTSGALVGVFTSDISDVSLIGSGATASFASKDAANGIIVTAGGFTISGSQAGNYTLSQPTGLTADITQKSISVASVTKVYDATVNVPTSSSAYTLSGVISGDTVDVNTAGLTGSYIAKDVGSGLSVSLGNVSLTGAQANDYTIASTLTGGLIGTITPAALSIVGVVADNKNYDGTTTATLTNTSAALQTVLGTDAVTLVTSGATATFAQKDVGNNIAVTASGYTITGTDAGNYVLSQPTGLTATISPALASVLTLVAVTKVYDGTNSLPTSYTDYTLSGSFGSDQVYVNTANLVGSYSGTGVPNVGANYTIDITGGLSLSGAQAADYSIPTTFSGSIGSITPKQLFLSIINTPTKTYDSTNTATLIAGNGGSSNYSLTGFVTGESATLNVTSGTYALANAGSESVSVSGLTASSYTAGSGTTLSNYFLPASATGSGFISQALLTILGVTATNKTYDGTTSDVLNVASAQLSGVQGSDVITLGTSGATGAFASPNVGTTINVAASGFTFSGSEASNYTLAQPTGLSADITQKALSLALVTKPYDSTTAAPSGASADSAYTLSGVVGSDAVSVDATNISGAYATPDAAGGLAITLTGIALTGSAAGNYSIASSVSSDPIGTITPLHLTATIINDPTKTYDSTTTATLGSTNYSLSGFVGAQSATVTQTVGAYALANAGPETVSASLSSSQFTAGSGTNLIDYVLPTSASGLGTINQALLTITATDRTKTYGVLANLGVTAFTETGLITLNGDRITGVTFTSPGIAATATVLGGPYTITPSAALGTGLGNYNIVYDNGLLTVTPKTLTITASNQSKIYGTTGSLGTTGFTDIGLVAANGDTLTGVTLTSTGAASTATVGNYTLTPSLALGTGLSNYNIVYDNASTGLTVSPATLTITAGNQSKVYGTTANLGTTAFNETGLVAANGDTLTGVTLTSTGSAATATVLGGPYAMTPSAAVGTGLSNYTIAYDNAPTGLTVTPAALTITASDQSKIYGTIGNLGTAGFTDSGLLNSDTVAGVTLTSSGSAQSATVLGGPYAITPSAATGSGLSNYTITYFNAPTGLTVTPATLTITANDQSKIYGTTASLGASDYTETGLVTANGDSISSVTLTSTGSASTATVLGAPYAIVPSAAGGTGFSNYTIVYDNAPIGLTVNPALLTITAVDQSKTYGTIANLGTTAFTDTGLVAANGDTLTGVTLTSSGSVATATVLGGPYAIIPSAAGGTGLANYTIVYDNAPTGLTVNPAALTITASDQSKIYGTTANLGTTAFTDSGLLNTDSISDVTLTSSGSARSATVAGGPYAITPSAAVGTGLSNYTITYDNAPTGLTVNLAALVITANDQSKVYGTVANLGSTGFTETGLVTANGDTISGVALTSSGTVATATVAGGPYVITPSAAVGTGLANYTIAYDNAPTGLTVNPAALVITASDQSKLYGTVANLGTTGFTETGLVTANGDTVSGVILASSGSVATATVAGGPYIITPSAAVGTGLANYTIAYDNAPTGLTVNPAALVITAADQSKVYGTTANLGTTGFTETGLVTANGDTIGGVTLTSAGTPQSATVATYTLTPSNALGAGLSNYTITYDNAPTGLTVTPAALVITASDQSKLYGTVANLGTTGFTESGLVTANGDTISGVTLASSGSIATASVAGGPYVITPSAAVGTGLANYTIAYDNAPTGLTVTPAALVITASDQSKVYGTVANLGTTGFTETGLVTANGDTISGVTLASAGSPQSATVATYTLTPSNALGAGLSNYTITYDNAPIGLTVTPAALIITASDQSKVYGTVGNLGTTGFTETGLVTANGDTVGGVTLASTGSPQSATVATYTLTPSAAAGTGLSNYTITYDNAPTGLTVTPAALTITASDQSKVYGTTGALGTTGFTETGLVAANGDTIGGVTLTSAGSAGTATVVGGPYAITPSAAVGTGLSNYTIAYDNAPTGLTVNPAALVITASDQSKVYGTVGNLGATGFIETGLLNSDTVTGVTLISSGSVQSATVGTYAIAPSAAAGSGLTNYTITYDNAPVGLTVNPAALTITANDQSKIYGTVANLGTTGFTETGLVAANGDTVSGVTLTSAGSSQSATVATYTLTPSAAAGTGLSNYTISYDNASTGLTVTPAALTITANDQSKVYGTVANLGTTGFTETGLVTANGDTVSSVILTSSGSAATATVLGGPYTVTPSAAVGSGLSNYTIVYDNGPIGLTVTPAALTITASDQSKIYGTIGNLGTTGFTETGLLNSDTVTGVTLASSGAAQSATVATYTLTASAAAGTGLSNYAITYDNAPVGLTVNPATLTITANDQSKVYGTVANLGTTAYTETGLVTANGDAIGGVTLSSSGSAAAATVLGGPYAIIPSAAAGTGLANYTIIYDNAPVGLTVNPASLTLAILGTPTKTYDGTTTANLAAADFSLTGFVSGQGGSLGAQVGTYSSANAGAETVTVSGLTSAAYTAVLGTNLSNYVLPSQVSVAGQINPALITASIVGTPTKGYDGTTAAHLTPDNFGLTGFVSGQGATVNQTVGTYASAQVNPSITVTATLSPGAFAPTGSTLLSNYILPTSASGLGAIKDSSITEANTGGFGFTLFTFMLQVSSHPPAVQKLVKEVAFEVADPRTYIPYPAPGALSTWRNNGLASLPIVLNESGGSLEVTDDGQIDVTSGAPLVNSTDQILLQGAKSKNWQISIDLGGSDSASLGGQ